MCVCTYMTCVYIYITILYICNIIYIYIYSYITNIYPVFALTMVNLTINLRSTHLPRRCQQRQQQRRDDGATWRHGEPRFFLTDGAAGNEWWINGLVLLGKIFTGNHRFSHEDHGAQTSKFSLKPIH